MEPAFASDSGAKQRETHGSIGFSFWRLDAQSMDEKRLRPDFFSPQSETRAPAVALPHYDIFLLPLHEMTQMSE